MDGVKSRAELGLTYSGVAASIAGSCTHPLDLTKVRLQTSGDKGMVQSVKKTVANNGTCSTL
jgi:dicarboxylate transporter 10